MKSLFYILTIIMVDLACLNSQINTVELSELFRQLESQEEFNGSVLIAQGEEIIFRANIGMADFDAEVPINDSTIFELASLGKQFTAMGIMILQERDKLDYDDLVRDHLPSFPYDNISIRHLLTMTSGITDYLNFSIELEDQEIATNNDISTFYASSAPLLEFEPGHRFKYSNVNYVFLAEVIKSVSSKSFESFLEEHIFKKLGMNSTRSYNTRFTQSESLPNYAYPYVKSEVGNVRSNLNEASKYIITLSAIEGDGCIVSSLGDLFKWSQALKTAALISEDNLAEAYSPYILNTGEKSDYGFGIYLSAGKAWHTGGWPGVQTSFTRYLEKDIVAIFLKNVESHNWQWISDFERILLK